MAYDPERGPNIKIDDDEIRKAQLRAKEEERKRKLAEAALKDTVKK